MKYSFCFLAVLFCVSCKKISNQAEFIQPQETSSAAIQAAIADPGTNMWIYANDKVPINPEIFGVNNDWARVTNADFPTFANALAGINNKILRYPGGFESEYYDWNANTTPGWSNTPNVAGATYTTMKNNVGKFSIVIPTQKALLKVLWSTEWWNAVADLELIAKDAINKVGANNVGVVEIGNEWWLQYAGGVTRPDKLIKYAKIAMNIAEYLEAQFPSRNFKLLVNGDYSVPAEFTTMKNAFTKAYNSIDGVALHTYTGYINSAYNIEDLGNKIQACSNNFNPNKDFIYCSEWAPSKAYNNNKIYMQGANIIPDIIQVYGRARVNMAAYWPPVNTGIPGLGLFNTSLQTTYPCGQIFGDMAASYKGSALSTTSNGNLRVAAALQSTGTMVLYVSGKDFAKTTASIQVNGFNLGSVVSAKKFRPANYAQTDDDVPYITENASVSIDQTNNKILFDVNSAGKYEIFKVTVKL